MWARASVSSGSMWTNCDDRQQAVHVPQGTSASCSPRSAACMPSSHVEKSPAGSLVLDPAWGAGKDAPVVARLKAGGAVITGKVSTMEFAVGFPDDTKPFPIPRNPWDTATWPGGSSSGSGNGVAAGMFLAAI